MFSQGERELLPYVTNIEDYQPEHFQILVINNSEADTSQKSDRLLGVLHKAEIAKRMLGERRIINSIMLASVSKDASVSISERDLQTFLESDQVAQKNY